MGDAVPRLDGETDGWAGQASGVTTGTLHVGNALAIFPTLKRGLARTCVTRAVGVLLMSGTRWAAVLVTYTPSGHNFPVDFSEKRQPLSGHPRKEL